MKRLSDGGRSGVAKKYDAGTFRARFHALVLEGIEKHESPYDMILGIGRAIAERARDIDPKRVEQLGLLRQYDEMRDALRCAATEYLNQRSRQARKRA